MLIQTGLLLLITVSGVMLDSAKECATMVREKLPGCTSQNENVDKTNEKALSDQCEKMEESSNCIKELIGMPECEEDNPLVVKMKETLESVEGQFRKLCSEIGMAECSMKIAKNSEKCIAMAQEVTAEPEPEPRDKKEDEDKDKVTEEECKKTNEVIGCFKDALDVEGCEDSKIAKFSRKQNLEPLQAKYSETCSCDTIFASVLAVMISIFLSNAL